MIVVTPAYETMLNSGKYTDAEKVLLMRWLLDRSVQLPERLHGVAEIVGAESIAKRERKVFIRFAGTNRFNAFAAVTAKAEFGDQLTISSGKITSISLFVGKTLDLDKILKLMRILRDAAEETIRAEKEAAEKELAEAAAKRKEDAESGDF